MSAGGLGMKIRAANAFVTLGVQDNLAKGLSMAERKLKDFGQRTASMATKLAGASLAVGGPALVSAQTFAGFEQTMARVRGLTNATKNEFTLLWQEAKRLGAETQFTARDAARGMSFYAQAGFQVKEIYDAMLPTLDLAAAGQLDVAESADILAKIMHGMGVPATDLAYHVDVLTKAMQTANTDLRQLGEAFKYAGAVAKTAGLSFEETTGFLQMMSNAGIQADMAGTTLRGALLALTSPSKEAAELLKDLKIDTSDANGNFVSLASVVGQFETALAGMGSQQRLEILGRIFDNRQASGFAEAVSKGGAELKRMTDALRNSSGAAERFRSIQMNTLAGQWELFTSAIETLQITIGEATAKPLRSLLRGLTDIVASVLRFVEANQWVVIVLGAVGVGLAIGAAYFLTLSMAAMGAQAAVQLFGFALSSIRMALTTSAVAMDLLMKLTKLFRGALLLLNASLIVVRYAVTALEIVLTVVKLAAFSAAIALGAMRSAAQLLHFSLTVVRGATFAFAVGASILYMTMWTASIGVRAFSAGMWLLLNPLAAVRAAVNALSISVTLLSNPWIALVAVVTGVVLLISEAMSGWDISLKDTGGKFSEMLEHIKLTMKGIYDAIVAGRIDLAFKILFAGAKLALTEGLVAISGMFGMTIGDLSKMIAELYKQLMQVVTKLNRYRAEASNWLAKQMGKIIGVDVQDGDSAALSAATEWQNAIDQIDTNKLAENIKGALEPDKMKDELQKLVNEAAQAADKAFQDPATGQPEPPRDPGNESLPDGVIGADATGEARKFANLGNLSASVLSRQLPGMNYAKQTLKVNQQQLKTLQSIDKNLQLTGPMMYTA